MFQSLSGSAVVFKTSCNTFNPFCENKLKKLHASSSAVLTHLCDRTMMKLHITAIINPTKKPSLSITIWYMTWQVTCQDGKNNWFSVWFFYAYTSAIKWATNRSRRKYNMSCHMIHDMTVYLSAWKLTDFQHGCFMFTLQPWTVREK